MLPFEDRYTRQRQLDEVGIAGQERLFQLHVDVPSGPGCRVEAEYLKRAGAHVQRVDTTEVPGFPHAEAFHQAEAREFASAVHRALARIRDALELSSTDSDSAS